MGIIAWVKLSLGLLVGILSGAALVVVFRKSLSRWAINREPDQTRRLVAEGRVDEAVIRLRRPFADSAGGPEAAGILNRQISAI